MCINFADTERRTNPPGWRTSCVRRPAPIITQHALDGKSELCRPRLEIFVSLYGAEAGTWPSSRQPVAFPGRGIAPKTRQLQKPES